MARKRRQLGAKPRRGLTTTTHGWASDSTPRFWLCVLALGYQRANILLALGHSGWRKERKANPIELNHRGLALKYRGEIRRDV